MPDTYRRLSDAEKQRYVDRDYCKCPYCLKGGIESGPARSSERENCFVAEVCCHDCGRTWTDVYKLHELIEDSRP